MSTGIDSVGDQNDVIDFLLHTKLSKRRLTRTKKKHVG